ncbi:HIT family protein [Williamsia sterculiae]|uniref:Diadenosine tetraphosphate (Ap4A) hydrolase n=1 Tax=Williamsia sterculiae TaxID=1344003 RepID=A0A1N7GYR0_9NOCA|nr:HIT family protein [Williamsia sterculiae]SIS17702.1 Diadenosine tetraphosphate (Ap4A) hydrolase [Williamsia sterculiae]
MTTVFSKIISGELPGRFVWRDDSVVAFLTINPVTDGHVLVVPIAEVDQWQSIDPALWAHLTEVAQTVGAATATAFDAARMGLLIAGFEVPHVHLHVFPAHSMDEFDLSVAQSDPDPARLDEARTKIADALVAAGHSDKVPS